MQQKIHEIHTGKLFGIFSETGCAGGTANALMGEPGSSKTVDFAIQPYNKNREVERYGIPDPNQGKIPSWGRSVSLHYINRVLDVEIDNTNEDDNFVFASSWQLDGICHGWIGLYIKETNTRHFLHYTIHAKYDRKWMLDHIAKIGVELLHSVTIDPTLESFKKSSSILCPAVLDMAYYLNKNKECWGGELIDYNLVIGSLEACEQDYPIVFEKGNMIRLEDLARRSSKQVIVKGSFNPMHQAHKDMADMTKAMEPGSFASLLISTARYDKPHIGTDELVDRIKFINEHGYPLIVVKEIYFYNTFRLMQNWMPEHKFFWPVGTDTLNRIYEADDKKATDMNARDHDWYIADAILHRVDKKRHQFMHYNRDNNVLNPKVVQLYFEYYKDVCEYVDCGVSSTKIRNGEMENDLNRE